MSRKVSAIILAGGLGTRMQTQTPKQFLLLKGKPIVRYSFDVLLTVPDVVEVIVVCEPEYRPIFEPIHSHVRIAFAPPGARRQDSVWNGFQAISANSELICIHDSARPLIDTNLVQRVLTAAEQHGAASVGMPLKFTLKEHNGNEFVKNTPDRSLFWEIQTPQVIKKEWLQEGFELVHQKNLTVTDDVSLVELLNYPVKLVKGSYANLKITTSEDLALAEHLIRDSRA